MKSRRKDRSQDAGRGQVDLFSPLIEGELHFEKALWSRGHVHVAGIDEAGRGPLAGPVVAAAVILPREVKLAGVKDSKLLSGSRREELFPRILDAATAVAAAAMWNPVIDEINILEATRRAMMKAVSDLSVPATHLLIDGNQRLATRIPQTTLVRGDSRSLSIAAASVVAKVLRDRIMEAMHLRWPEYGFAKNRGYPTRAHRAALSAHGPCPIHRLSFRPVRALAPSSS